jgi:hypothetical protein
VLMRTQRAARRAADLAPVIREIQATGASLRQIAAALNDRRIPTARGSGWTATTDGHCHEPLLRRSTDFPGRLGRQSPSLMRVMGQRFLRVSGCANRRLIESSMSSSVTTRKGLLNEVAAPDEHSAP